MFLFGGLIQIFILKKVQKPREPQDNGAQLPRVVYQETCANTNSFVFSLSHELRNPLNSMIGNLELALKDVVEPKVTKYLKTAQTCGDILLHLINNILDSTKVEQERLEVTSVETNISDLMAKAWSVSREMIKRKGLGGFLYFSTSIPNYLHIDPHRIVQVLLNLLSNSTKFTDKGCITVKVKWIPKTQLGDDCFEPIPYSDEGQWEKNQAMDDFMRRSIGPAGFQGQEYMILDLNNDKFVDKRDEPMLRMKSGIIKISVTDTGCGMSQEAQGKLFQKFSQVNKDPLKRQNGTGLGLWITKEIVRKMGGEIRVYSREGFGSTFVVCLVCQIPTETIMSPLIRMQTMFSPDKIRMMKNSKLNALIIENNIYGDSTSSFLEKIDVKIGGKMTTVDQALLQIKKLNRYEIKVNIIVLDLDNLNTNGQLACKKIRNFEKNNKLNPVTLIVIGSNPKEHEVKELLAQRDCGVDYFRKKPVYFDDFEKIILNISCDSFKVRIGSDLSISGPDKKKRILFADDDDFARELILRIFDKTEFEIIATKNGKLAVEIFQVEHCEIDLVFLDSQMDTMGGLEASSLILEFMKSNNLKAVPVIIITGESDPAFIDQCYRMGVTKVMTKPIRPDELKKLARNMTRRKEKVMCWSGI